MFPHLLQPPAQPWLMSAKVWESVPLLIIAPMGMCNLHSGAPCGSRLRFCLPGIIYPCFDSSPSLSVLICSMYNWSLSQGQFWDKAEKIPRIIPGSVLDTRLRSLTEICFLSGIQHSLGIMSLIYPIVRYHVAYWVPGKSINKTHIP